ncbi:hypothetical protein IJG76_00270 [Candidatus Saccharibacteria bacterium]|nr:hypothetical protein [Candidatus Saccharibacteria bacterium]
MSNEELQKAIDDITKEETQAEAPAPEAPVETPAPAVDANGFAMPEAPVVPPVAQDGGMPMPPAPEVAAPAPAESAPAPAPEINPAAAAPSYNYAGIPEDEPRANLVRIKEDALRELFPLMDKVSADPLEKFRIYKEIATMTHEKAAIGAAHEVVKTIPDDEIKAGALIELLGMINNFK